MGQGVPLWLARAVVGMLMVVAVASSEPVTPVWCLCGGSAVCRVSPLCVVYSTAVGVVPCSLSKVSPVCLVGSLTAVGVSLTPSLQVSMERAGVCHQSEAKHQCVWWGGL